jgi:RES domain-containing protein
LSLAILELIVHLNEYEDLQDYVAIPVEFEDAQIETWPEEKLPKNWSSLPVPDQTQNMGKIWLEEKQSLVLKVPSSVVPHDNNFVINPLHPDFSTLKVGQPIALQIDRRLTGRLP